MTAGKLVKRIIPLLIIALSFNLYSSGVIATNNTDKQVSKNVWNLLQWNENNVPEWWPRSIYIHAQAGTKVMYNITHSLDNMTYPNNGTFTIGNATNIITNNFDLANTFALSIYPWAPGFVADPYNWTGQINLAKEGASPSHTNGTLSITQGTTQFSNYNRTTYKFVFNQSLTVGNQNTTLIYDKSTGVLIYGFSEVSYNILYKIEVALSSSTLITGSNDTSKSSPGFTLFIPLTMLVTIVIIKKKRTQKNT